MWRPGTAVISRENGTWQGATVTRCTGSLLQVEEHLPRFDRRPFQVTTGLSALTSDNPNYDVIVRVNGEAGYGEVPVGVVSKKYTLVTHRKVFAYAAEALTNNDIDPNTVQVDLDLTDLGERMELTFTLPEEFQHDPGDGHPVGLQVRCMNSVDGSTRFMALVGWFRWVCANGMVVGTATSQMRRVHNQGMAVDDIGLTIRAGLQAATEDLNRFREWARTPTTDGDLRNWIDTDVKEFWGVKAATRAFHIVTTGTDVSLANPFEQETPSRRAIKEVSVVPGADPLNRNAYTVSQALAWLARDRRDLQERHGWMEDIPELMVKLLSSST